MKFVLALVLVLAIISVPPVRAHVAPVLEPGKKRLVGLLMPQVARVRDPVLRWSVANEARSIALELAKRERAGQSLPRPQDFQIYLRQRTLTGVDPVDKWGSPYYLLLTGDSIIVVSPGPDQRPGSADDIRFSVDRTR